MKKILFATTALVATAGVAAAEVSFGGYGRFGLRYDETATEKTHLESRFRMNIDASATSDGGVRFSARIRVQADDNADDTAGNAGINAARFSAEYEGLRLDVGNAAGALDNLPNYYGYEPGLSNFVGQYAGADYAFTGYASGAADTPQTLYARYAFDAFAAAASYTENAGTASDGTTLERWDIHFAYSGDTWTAAIGYGSNNDDEDMVVATGQFGVGPFDAVVFLGTESFEGTKDDMFGGTFYGVSASYDIGAATSVNFSYGGGNGDNDRTQYGIGFIHDLGGGVTIRGGIGHDDKYDEATADMVDGIVGDLGVRFDF